MPKIERTSAPAPHIASWYVKMPPRTTVLTFEQLTLAFRQGLIDSRTLVANDAVPSWTSLGRLASLPAQGTKPQREPITEKRRRVLPRPTEPPARAAEPDTARAGTSLPAAPAPAVSVREAQLPLPSLRLAAAFQDWRAWALAVVLALGSLPIRYHLLRPRVTAETISLPPLQPRVPAAPVPEPLPSALLRDIGTSIVALEPLPIVRASSLPLAPTRRLRQHTRRRRSHDGADSDRLVVETAAEMARTTQPRSAR